MAYGAKLKAGFVAALVLIGWGCSAPSGVWQTVAPQQEAYRLSGFAHRMVSQDVEVYWNCSRPRPTLLRLDGISKNIGKGEVHLLGMELHDVDRQTSNVLQSGAAVSDVILYPDIFSPVQVEVQPATADGQIDLLYTYRITSVGILKTAYTDKEFVAHDVCAATQYPNLERHP